MGNRNGQAANQQFKEEEWQKKEELGDCQVWQSKLQPQLRIQSHDIYTQNTAEVEREGKMFELRKRSPLLVSAYFLQLQPKEEFCSFHNRHSLFLQRVPIRLADIEHVPYPDYLHLYDSCIKGYAQLARHVGCFIVDEGMVGINEQCVAKGWLSQDFASSKPFNANITEEIMVASLLDTLDRSIDVEDLPPNVPSVRDFLNRGKVARSFDALLWQFGDFVRIYNNGQLPIRLDCIDRAGGIAVIANREKSVKMGRSNVSNRRIGSQVKDSQIGGRVLQNSNQTRSMALIQPVKALPNPYQNQVVYYPQQVYPTQVRNPVSVQQNGLRKSQITVLPSLPIAQNIRQFVNQPPPQPHPFFRSVQTSQVSPPQLYTHRVSNAPKFTVQVIPGKVYPQKSSTIFLSSSKAIPAASSQPQQTLDSIHPIIAHSQKDMIKEDQPSPQQQVQSLVNSEAGNMRSYTVDEEKYSPDNFYYQRETHQVGKEEQGLQSYIPNMDGTAVFRNVESIQEQEPDFNNELMLSFNPAKLDRNLQEAVLPISKQEEWKNQAHFTNSEGQLSPRDEEPVIVEYAGNQEALLQSANFGLQSYSNEAYNASASFNKEQQPTLYNYGSYGQASYSNHDQTDGKSSLQLMRELAATRSLATEPSYQPNASSSDYYSKYLASLTQDLPSFPQDSQIRQTGTFRL